MTAIGQPNRQRALKIGAACVVLAAAAVFIPRVMGAGADTAASHPLGDRGVASALTTAPVASPPEGLRVLAKETGEADLSSTRILGAAADQAFYALESLKDPGRICLAATGGSVGLWCGPAAAMGTGKLIIRQPIAPGGPGTPAVYFGLVPDGVASVSVGGAAVPVASNVFSIYESTGELPPQLAYATADGAVVAVVDPFSGE